MPAGYWCPVLHAHLPYVRHPEYPDFLEEDWFFEALTETYVPLVRVMDGLLRDGVDYRLTMTLSPPLLSMMTDALLVERYHRYLERLITLAEKEVDAHDPRRTRASPTWRASTSPSSATCAASSASSTGRTSWPPSASIATRASSRSSPAARRTASFP